MAGNISNLYTNLSGVKQDFKTNWVDNTASSWKLDFPHSTTSSGVISTLGTVTGGSSYTNGTYTGVVLTGGTGSGATATITVAGGAVTNVVLISGGTGYAVNATLSATAATIGGTGSGFSVPVASLVVGVSNSVAPVVTGTPAVGSTLTSSTGTWAGNPTYSYQWVSTYGGRLQNATSSTYVVQNTDAFASLYCEVTGVNTSTASAAKAKSNSIVILATPVIPANVTAPTIKGNPVIDQRLTVVLGTWTGYPSPKFTYQWNTSLPGIASVTFSGGSGYNNGTYAQVPLVYSSSGTGAGATATFTVTGGVVTSIIITGGGYGYAVNDSLVPSLTTNSQQHLGSGTGFTVTVATVTVAIPGAAEKHYLTQQSDASGTLSCTVTATNSAGSASVTTVGVGPILSTETAPVNTAIPTISGTATVGSTLTGSAGTWTGSPTPTYTYQWLSRGVAVKGAVLSTYVVQPADVGRAISLVVTAGSAGGSASATSAPTSSIPAVIPSNSVSPAIVGTPSVGSTLEATLGTWTGAPTPTYTYQWKNGGSAISGAVLRDYVVQSADIGATLTLTITASNSAGSTAVTTAGVVGTAAPTAPHILTVGSIADTTQAVAGKITVGDTLTATPATFSGSPTPTYTYKWNANGAPIPNATNTTYVVGSGYVGMDITFTTKAINSAAPNGVFATTPSVGTVVHA